MWLVWKSGMYFTHSGDWSRDLSDAYVFATRTYAEHIAYTYRGTVITA